MTTKDDVDVIWGNHFDSAIGYYELGMLDEAEAELRKAHPSTRSESVLVLALRLGISYNRRDWNKMKLIARKLFELDPSNPRWPFADGFATGKIDSITRKQH